MTDEVRKNWEKIAEGEPEKQAEETEHLEDDTADEDGGSGDVHVSGALDHPSYKELEDKLTQAEMQAHENWEKSVRAVAELENFRKRAERDVERAHKYGIEKFVDGLLPVIDSLEQALQSADSDNEAHTGMIEGIELTRKLLLDCLEKHGVSQINPEGEAFDPQHHEAMSIQEIEGVAPNTVTAVVQKGYLLHGRVVRPARVMVAK